MKVSELYDQVARLGFEEGLEDNRVFTHAANRAILQVGAIRPALRAVTINHRPFKNLVADGYTPREKTADFDITVSGSPVSYSFECEGTGSCYIEVEANGTFENCGVVQMTGRNGFVRYFGFIKHNGEFIENTNVRLRFVGEFFYTVKNVAIYESRYSNDASDIPAFAPFVRFDFGTDYEDFLSFETPPIREEDGYRIGKDYDIENGRVLLLPYDKTGNYNVYYRRKPALINIEEDVVGNMDDIDLIDDEICSLLPLLVAAYALADDDPNKAEYYLSLYRERVALIEANEKRNRPVVIKTNGW